MHDRIRKLLALANNNPNEHEALAAMEKAFTLAAQYNIDMTTLRTTPEADGVVSERFVNKRSEKQFWYIYKAVAELNGCEYFVNRHSQRLRNTTHMFVGRRTNVTTAIAMGDYLCDNMRRLANARANTICDGSKAHHFNSFMHGFAMRIYARCVELRRQAEQGELKVEGRNLPALLSTYKRDAAEIGAWLKANGYIENVVTRKSHSTKVDPVSYALGVVAGNKVGIHRQVKEK